MGIKAIRAHQVDLTLYEANYKWSGWQSASVSVFGHIVIEVESTEGLTDRCEVFPLAEWFHLGRKPFKSECLLGVHFGQAVDWLRLVDLARTPRLLPFSFNAAY